MVAVTKGFGPEAVRAAHEAGLVHLGENYAHELVRKATGPRGSQACWHFLGALQRNKIRRLAPFVHRYEALGRLVEGEALARHHPGASVLVELEASGRPGRPGRPAAEVPPLVRQLRHLDLEVAGLMTVAPPEPAGARRAFRLLASLADELGLPERSMGMSDDLELAVEAGATTVRVGRALFGPRPPRARADGGGAGQYA